MRAAQVIGKEGYESLKSKTIAIVGIGGTGCTVANLLARLPLKKIVLIDRDIVEDSNVERQILFTKEDINKSKVFAAKEHLKDAIHQSTELLPIFDDLNFKTIQQSELKTADLIIDCTDNTETRLLLNDFCKRFHIPWIYSAGVGQSGSVAFINTKDNDSHCFNCFNKSKFGMTCAQAGVLPTTVSFVGSLAAHISTIFLSTGNYPKQLLHINLETVEVSRLNLPKDPNCRTCNGVYDYLEGTGAKKVTKLCGENRFAVNLGRKIDLNEAAVRLNTSIIKNCIQTEDFTIFEHGRILVAASSESEAKKKVDEHLGF